MPGDAVPAGADGDRQPAVARVGERERDVVGARAPGDQRGPFVDHRVEDGPSLVVAAVVRGDLLAGEASNRSHSVPPVGGPPDPTPIARADARRTFVGIPAGVARTMSVAGEEPRTHWSSPGFVDI